jgi:hypothetical protein
MYNEMVALQQNPRLRSLLPLLHKYKHLAYTTITAVAVYLKYYVQLQHASEMHALLLYSVQQYTRLNKR